MSCEETNHEWELERDERDYQLQLEYERITDQ